MSLIRGVQGPMCKCRVHGLGSAEASATWAPVCLGSALSALLELPMLVATRIPLQSYQFCFVASPRVPCQPPTITGVVLPWWTAHPFCSAGSVIADPHHSLAHSATMQSMPRPWKRPCSGAVPPMLQFWLVSHRTGHQHNAPPNCHHSWK